MLTKKQIEFFGEKLSKKIENIAKITNPKEIKILTGERNEKEFLIERLLKEKKLVKLKWKNCYLYRTKPYDAARSEASTYIATKKKEDAGPTNNWLDPKKIRKKLFEILKDSMEGKTMYVVPYILGPENSPYSKIGVMLTDNEYVALNELILAKVTKKAVLRIKKGEDFVFGIHSTCKLDPKNRYIVHFPERNEIISVNTEYGGNAILTKKCHSLRIASYQARKEGWLAEHMMAIQVITPKKESFGISAAFPSMCGKTNLATIKPEKEFKSWKVKLLSDDIVWIHERKGKAYAINPEYGMFGVANGVNEKTNSNIMETIKEDTIFTNVGLTENLEPWWDGLETKSKILEEANPNSRFTVSILRYKNLSKYFFDPYGLKIDAILFGSRRKELIPLVFETFSWEEGVLFGAMLRSETTAAAIESYKQLKNDPMAMRPFCGYDMAKYFSHWLKFGKKLKEKPRIFVVNWFRRDEKGNFIWPGFNKNMYVINWIVERIKGKATAIETPIGFVPDYNKFDFGIEKERLEKLFEIDRKGWLKELSDAKEFFSIFSNFPKDLSKTLSEVERRVKS